jgi:hypothetical protein
LEPFHELAVRARAARTITAEAIANQKIEVQLLMNALGSAQDSIRSGEDTTGSYLHDQLIMFYGWKLAEDLEIVEDYENIVSRLEGKVGEPVVLIHWWDEQQSTHVLDSHTVKKRRIQMGIISSDELRFSNEENFCVVPTDLVLEVINEEYVSGELYVSEDNIAGGISLQRKRGDKDDSYPDISKGLNKFHTPKSRHLGTYMKLQLLIGHEEIDQWMSGQKFRSDAELVLLLARDYLPESNIQPNERQKRDISKGVGEYTLIRRG